MTEEVQPIQGLENGAGVSTPSSQVVETPNPGRVSEIKETPAQPPVDVDAIRAKYEQDINNLKSSLQRRESQVSAEWQDRYTKLQKEMHEVRMSTMTEEDRKRYEAQLQTEEYQSLQSRLAELENERQTSTATFEAYQFFLSQGVPPTAMNLTEGYEGVTRAGWGYITDELSRLRQVATNPQPQPKPEPAPLKDAPGVVTDKGIPATGTTWAALVAKYGSRETVYRAVEEGRLPASIIPTEE
jgi:hypothetical protein